MSAAHRAAAEVMLTLRAATKDIGEHLSQQHAVAKTRNREAFYHITGQIFIFAPYLPWLNLR